MSEHDTNFSKVCAGYCEDEYARWSYEKTKWKGYKQEVELWTTRSVVPACAAFIHPLIAWKFIDGSLKGADSAMAELNGFPLQVWCALIDFVHTIMHN